MKIFYIVVLLSTFLFASEISEAFGDLDGDSKDERVVVWQDSDLHRVLQIFKFSSFRIATILLSFFANS